MIFKLYIGGYFAGYFELAYKNKQIICFVSDYPLRPLEPTKSFSVLADADWEILLQYLKNQQWKAGYSAEVIDGTQWSLKFKDGDIQVNSEGSNAYPRGFKRFIYLLNKTTRKHGIAVKV